MFFVPLANMLGSSADAGRHEQGPHSYVRHMRDLWVPGLLSISPCNVSKMRTPGWVVGGLRAKLAATPALVNGDIAQNIRYTPDNFRRESEIIRWSSPRCSNT